MNQEQLRKKLERIRQEQDFFKRIELLEQPGPAGGKINLADHELQLNYDPKFHEGIDDKHTKRYLEKKNIPPENSLETLVTDLLYHEIGHRGIPNQPGCPGDVKILSVKFLDPIYQATKIE